MTSITSSLAIPSNPASNAQPKVTQLSAANAQGAASGGISFGDIVDTVNPLQHIPVVSSAYRALTGSKIASGSEALGDAAYGVVLGGGLLAVGSSAANFAVDQASGQGITAHLIDGITSASTSLDSSPSTVATNNDATIKSTQALTGYTPGGTDYKHHGHKQYEQAVSLNGLPISGLNITS